jgi:hypothetical protein
VDDGKIARMAMASVLLRVRPEWELIEASGGTTRSARSQLDRPRRRPEPKVIAHRKDRPVCWVQIFSCDTNILR